MSLILILSMGIKASVSFTVLFTILDIVISTVLYVNGSQWSSFISDALNFNIVQSSLDLWATVLLRASLLLGACLGVSWNRQDGPRRIASSTTLIVFICLIAITYTLAKMLMLTEVEPLAHRPWLLSLICWTCASYLCVMLFWGLLGKETNLVSSHNSSSINGGEQSEDTEQLVGEAGDEEQKEGRKKRKVKKDGSQEEETVSSGATLGRVLAYCRQDCGLLSVAVLFLLIAAVCEYL